MVGWNDDERVGLGEGVVLRLNDGGVLSVMLSLGSAEGDGVAVMDELPSFVADASDFDALSLLVCVLLNVNEALRVISGVGENDDESDSSLESVTEGETLTMVTVATFVAE